MKTGEPLYIQPQAYRDRRESQLREWGTLIDKYQAEVEQAEAKAEVEAYYEQIQFLRAKHEKARRMLQDLEQAEGQSWEALTADIDEAFEELDKALQRAASEIG